MKRKYEILKQEMEKMNLDFSFEPHAKGIQKVLIDEYEFYFLEKEGVLTPTQWLEVLNSLGLSNNSGIAVHKKEYKNVLSIFLSGFVCDEPYKKVGKWYFIPTIVKTEITNDQYIEMIKKHISEFLEGM